MKKFFTLVLCTILSLSIWAVDMQAHMGTKEAQEAYTAHIPTWIATNSSYSTKYAPGVYYTGDYAPEALRALSGNDLFGALNSLMGSTSNIGGSSFTYNSLRNQYVNVDKDLNTSGYIIGYYDGSSINGTWNGTTYNREHTWPQSKGADKGIPMGHDMQSVRPTSSAVNSDRGNAAYGESSGYYDPNDVSISNTLYRSENLGSYRGDAARVIIYDYIVYGEAGGHKNSLYNGNAQLLSKLGSGGVFESIPVLLRWHMNDPVSLTEMVRNEGATIYQGNRNPFIDYPELAIQMLKNASGVSTYNVETTGVSMWPAYTLTLSSGFIAYLGDKDNRPDEVIVTGATAQYNKTLGRLTISNVTGKVSIVCPTTAVDLTTDGQRAIKTIHNGQVVILKGGKMYNLMGQVVE